jgi:hypothetical protein
MKTENSVLDLQGSKPRSNAYQYVVHRIHESGAGVSLADSLDDAIDIMSADVRMAPETGMIHAKCYRDDLIVMFWHRSMLGIYSTDMRGNEQCIV